MAPPDPLPTRPTQPSKQVAPRQLALGQMTPRQMALGQMAPRQMVPGQLAPQQVTTWQVTTRQVTTRQVKAILNPSNLPHLDLAANPYLGCTHGCIYCYARYMQRQSSARGPWGSFVEVKDWPRLTVAHDARRLNGKRIILGSATDPYLPEEAEFNRTRQLLTQLRAIDQHCRGVTPQLHRADIVAAKMAPTPVQGSLLTDLEAEGAAEGVVSAPVPEAAREAQGLNLTLITKSDLILRDLELLAQFAQLRVVFSINTLDEQLKAQLDRAPSIARRLTALQRCHEAGLATSCFIAPIMPGLTDVAAIIHAVRPWCDQIWLDRLNLSPCCKEPVLQYIATQHPHLTPLYHAIYDEHDEHFWHELDRYLRQIATACGLDYQRMLPYTPPHATAPPNATIAPSRAQLGMPLLVNLG